ncbi:MBOAT family O-acyltransferase [Deinococcus misasensis]|uniref:MBOAT family O-acyltransferase n=1 Tax=Deinococcus misasensis TaxID=392413 RepID=UPI00055119C6|nr:MBOAT family O-acyltransferase [Deinococcus misasensis]
MPFSSWLFVFCFLPLMLGAYHLTPQRHRLVLLMLVSWGFYALWDVRFLLVLLGVSLVAHLTGEWVSKTDKNNAKTILTVGVVINLLALGVFKYLNFGIETFNALLTRLNLPEMASVQLLLPLGLSFYVFNSISYMVDVYRKDGPRGTFWSVSAHLGAFMHVMNGPILHYKKYHALFTKLPQPTFEDYQAGITRFVVGFSKKVLLADPLGPLVQASFSQPNPTVLDSWVGMFAYTIQLYFDFSGYSDMAIGVARMMGFRYPENFNHPYLARSVTEFWQRWHLSLSNFLKNYLYFSLGGNRKGQGRTYLNLMLTMTIGGLWHGANWTFVIWGAWNGFFLTLERFLKDKFNLPAPPVFYALPKTLLLIMMSRLFFRSDTVTQALGMFAGLVGVHGVAFSPAVALSVTPERVLTLLIATVVVFTGPWFNRQMAGTGGSKVWQGVAQFGLLLVFVQAMLMVGVQDFTPFLYFRF